jgi:hypothetical protein
MNVRTTLQTVGVGDQLNQAPLPLRVAKVAAERLDHGAGGRGAPTGAPGAPPARRRVTGTRVRRSIDMSAFILLAVLASVLVSGCGAAEDGAPAPSREPTIEPRKAIGGVRLQMTAADVRARLGEADAVGPSDLHGGWMLWTYRDRRLRVTFTDDRVWDIRTTHPGDRTTSDIGVGSSEREVREAMPDMRCEPYGGPRRRREWRICVDAGADRGPFTQLTLVRGRVKSVKVAQGVAL